MTPKHFKHQLAKFHSHFAGYNQHDSQVGPRNNFGEFQIVCSGCHNGLDKGKGTSGQDSEPPAAA